MIASPSNDDHKGPDAAAPPVAKQRAKPPMPAPTDALPQWVDPTDLADREAYERTRRDQEADRPPHW